MVKEKALYKHFKGTTYYVHFVSWHTEDEEKLVSYQKCETTGLLVGKIHTRPLENFCSSVEVDGCFVPRFSLLSEV